MVTEGEAQRILEAPKVIGANLAWRRDGGASRLEVNVLCPDTGEILSLRGFLGRTNRSFTLLYQNTPIRKYTVHAFHRDPVTREHVTEPHKHTWDDEWGDQRVYLPDDIRIGNPDEELVDFLAECNITLRGSYP